MTCRTGLLSLTGIEDIIQTSTHRSSCTVEFIAYSSFWSCNFKCISTGDSLYTDPIVLHRLWMA